MKKKLTALLLASAIAVSAVGLTACGGDENDSAFKSEKIASEADWLAAFDYDDIDNATYVMLEKIGDIEVWSSSCYYDGLKYYGSETELGDSIEEYVEIKDNTHYYYSYDSESESWQVESMSCATSHDGYECWGLGARRLGRMVDEFDDVTSITERYADYRYDESSGAYVAEYESVGDWTDCKVAVKFKDGKIVEGKATATDEEGNKVYIEMTVSAIGTTTVNLPTVE